MTTTFAYPNVRYIEMNSKTAIPVIGMSQCRWMNCVLSIDLAGLGGWAPPTEEARKEAKIWISSAIKVGRLASVSLT